MRLVIRILGAEVIAIETGPETPPGPGDCTTHPVGFVPSPGDQRWEKGVDT
jgi:hypothetical protein